MKDAIGTMADYMENAHKMYQTVFGIEMRGTSKQFAALIELCPQLREAIRLWDKQRIEQESV